ncbi:MAG: extracellular solute-binding protein, partial [Anaerovorax sp.]
EKDAEKKFPQLDIIQVGNYTADMGIAEYEARLKNNDLTDMVMTWPLDVGEEYWEDCLMDLSALPLSSKYATAMLNDISRHGKLYYLPGPSQVRGIVYNKTLFQENGWVVPDNYEGFIQLCKDIEAAGIRSLQLGLGNKEVLDTAFVGYGYESSFSKPENMQNIENYNQGKGSFADNFMPALETFQNLLDEGVLQKGDLKITYDDREKMLFNRQCAMIEDSVLLTRKGMEVNGCTDEFALMPFFNPNAENSDWARLYPVCYIGLNKQLTKDENKEKLACVMDLVEYISTPEGQIALAGDTDAMFSALKGVHPVETKEAVQLRPALEEGRYAIFPTLKNAQEALRSGLAGMVEGQLTMADVVKMVDKQNSSPPIPMIPTVIGKATEDFTLIDTGNFITDAMREKTGCEIALFLDNGKDGKSNQKGVSGRLYQGEITTIDIEKRIMPDFKYGEKGEIRKITMSGEDLRNTLEYAIPVENKKVGWFYYFSGLNMEYDPTAKPGTRIHKIRDLDGKEIDPQRIYSIAVTDENVPNEYVKTSKKTGILVKDVVVEAIVDAGVIQPAKDNRFIF